MTGGVCIDDVIGWECECDYVCIAPEDDDGGSALMMNDDGNNGGGDDGGREGIGK